MRLTDKQLNKMYDYERSRLLFYSAKLKATSRWRFVERRKWKALIADASFQCQSLEMKAR